MNNAIKTNLLFSNISLAIKEEEIIKLFKEKGAVNIENAREFTSTELSTLKNSINHKDFRDISFIEQVQGSNKFFLNTEKYEKAKKNGTILLAATLGFSILVILAVILSNLLI